MQQYIRKYFALNKTVALPGIGSFTVETQNAKLDFIEKISYPPKYSVSYNTYDKTDDAFYDFLSRETGANDAIERFNYFTQQLKEQLDNHHAVTLNGIGTLAKNEKGYSFAADSSVQKYFPNVVAERVIRQSAQHTVRVGEEHRTSTEMHEHLKRKVIKEDNWIVTALVLGIIGVAAIALYYLMR
jgi:nucleoid DNA-binding protein